MFLVYPETTLPGHALVKGRSANFVIFLDFFEFLSLVIFSVFLKKIGFGGILGPPYYCIGATIRTGEEMLCLPYAGFFIKHNFLNSMVKSD